MAFEAICLKHIDEIKRGLGIESVETEEAVWRYHAGKDTLENGAQIDLLIDRRDHCINICEIKFSSKEYSIDKSYANELQRKVSVFAEKPQTRKALFLTMITTFGIKPNSHSKSLVHKELTFDVFF